MHGGSLTEAILPRYDALRNHPFWFQGKLFGRQLPT